MQEWRQRTEESLLDLAEQVVAPGKGVVQALLTRVASSPFLGEETDPGWLLDQGARRKRCNARRSQFDRQRNAPELHIYLSHGRNVVAGQLECCDFFSGAFKIERHSRVLTGNRRIGV